MQGSVQKQYSHAIMLLLYISAQLWFTWLLWYFFIILIIFFSIVLHQGSMIFWPTMTSLPGNWWASSSKFLETSWGDRKTACRDIQRLQLHQQFFLLPVHLQRVMREIALLEMHLVLYQRSQGSTGRKFLLFLVMLINICVPPAPTPSTEIGVCPFAILLLMRPTAPHCETLNCRRSTCSHYVLANWWLICMNLWSHFSFPSGWLLGLGVDLNFKFTKNHKFSHKSHPTNSYEITTS